VPAVDDGLEPPQPAAIVARKTAPSTNHRPCLLLATRPPPHLGACRGRHSPAAPAIPRSNKCLEDSPTACRVAMPRSSSEYGTMVVWWLYSYGADGFVEETVTFCNMTPDPIPWACEVMARPAKSVPGMDSGIDEAGISVQVVPLVEVYAV